MDCGAARGAASALLDGELPTERVRALDEHLAGCPACRTWQAGAVDVTRRVRLRPAPEAAPDLTAAVLAAVQRPGTLVRPRRSLARLLLAAAAVAQLAVALPALLVGKDVAASLHVAHEVGATEVALAVGVLAAAWRPWRAAGMLPVVAALAVGLMSTTLTDVLDGEVPAVHELPHLLAVAEALLLWRMRHSATTPDPPGVDEAGRHLRSVA